MAVSIFEQVLLILVSKLQLPACVEGFPGHHPIHDKGLTPDTDSLYSSVAEHWSCKPGVESSILSGGMKSKSSPFCVASSGLIVYKILHKNTV